MTQVHTESRESGALSSTVEPKQQWPIAAIALALATAFGVLALRAALSHWLSLGDRSLIELRTRDVGTLRTPFVGPYSRYGWNHPGPLLFYVLAPWYRLFGEHATGLLVGALAINAASISAVLVVCWRRGRTLGVFVGATILLLLLHGLRPQFLVDPWNPRIIVLAMLAFAMVCWDAVETNSRWSLPVAVGLGCFLVQSHVGAAFAVLTLLAITVVYVVLDARRTRRWVELRTTALFAAGVGLLCWLLPMIEEFRHDGGNLRALWKFWTAHHDVVTGPAAGARIVSAQLALPAPWFHGHESVSPFTGGVVPTWHLPIALVMLVVAFVAARRTNDRQSLRLCVLAFGLIGAAWLSASRIIDTPFEYLVQWIWIVGAFTWFAIAWTASRRFLKSERAERVTMYALCSIAAILVAVLLVDSTNTDILNPGNDERSLRAFAPTATRALTALPGPVLVERAPDLGSGDMSNAIAVLALHAGVDVRFPNTLNFVVGPHRTIDPERAVSSVVVTINEAINKYEHDGAFRQIASYDPRTPQEETELHAIQLRQFEAANRDASAVAWLKQHPEALAKVNDLANRGPSIAIFARIA